MLIASEINGNVSQVPNVRGFNQSLERKGGFGRSVILFHVESNKNEPPEVSCVRKINMNDKIRQAPPPAFNIKTRRVSTVCLKHLFKCQYPVCFGSNAGFCVTSPARYRLNDYDC